jgi:hypothetical protein
MLEYDKNILFSKALYKESAPIKLNSPTHRELIISNGVNDNVNAIPNTIDITNDIYTKQLLHFIIGILLNF